MKKRTRLLAGLLAAVMALCVAGVGFAQWSSEINLNGGVTANGIWDVGIADARITSISSATKTDGELTEIVPRYEVTVYDVYTRYFDYSGNVVYRACFDDANARRVSVSYEELKQYTEDYKVSSPSKPASLTSGKRCSGLSFQINLNELGLQLGFKGKSGPNSNIQESNDYDNQLIGTAICSKDLYPKQNTAGIVPEYNEAKAALSGQKAESYYAATISEDRQSATYQGVTLSLPGAWAEYSVTLANHGTADANLSEYRFEVAGAGEAVAVNVPDLTGEVLRPGEECIVTFVVQVPADYAENTLAVDSALTVRLVYVQNAVEAAPAPTHIH